MYLLLCWSDYSHLMLSLPFLYFSDSHLLYVTAPFLNITPSVFPTLFLLSLICLISSFQWTREKRPWACFKILIFIFNFLLWNLRITPKVETIMSWTCCPCDGRSSVYCGSILFHLYFRPHSVPHRLYWLKSQMSSILSVNMLVCIDKR
jgi:hypothetical protein